MRLKVVSVCMGLALLGACSHKQKAAPEATASTPAAAAAATASKKEKAKVAASAQAAVTCKTKTETRSLRVEAADKGCKLFYSNHSATEPVATSVNGTAHCDKVKANIQAKLAAAGYACE